MGKKRRLNKLISKWIKSDLPDDRSSVLLLRATRAPPSPKPAKRPFSLPLALGVVSSCSKGQVGRNSSSVSNGRRPSVGRRDSRRGPVVKGERPEVRPPKSPKEESNSQRSRAGDESVKNCQQIPAETSERGLSNCGAVQTNHCLAHIANIRLELKEPDIPLEHIEAITEKFRKTVINDLESGIHCIRKTISDRRSAFLRCDSAPPLPNNLESRVKITLSSPKNRIVLSSGPDQLQCSSLPRTAFKPTQQCKASSNRLLVGDDPNRTHMETSVDSIGKCSLDMEASRELPADWSEVGSTGTLRGSKVLAPQVERQQHHLPSYLSLACTVNGYSTTTNYDPVRLARSRDASPHRLDNSYLTTDQHQPVYSVTNNLLSPPNLVPLPTPKTANESSMSDEALRTDHPKDYYCYTKTVTFYSNESHHYSNSMETSKDSTDACVRKSSNNCRELFAYSRTMDGNVDSTTISKEYTNGKETKSFIQQRVERLYGPGALAQGFFVSKRQKNRLSECEETNSHPDTNKLNSTLPDKFSDEENVDPVPMKQGNNSSSLPVLRHLRPEFRAQLPLASPRKVAEVHIQKSVTVPKLTNETNVNGVVVISDEKRIDDELPVIKQNGSVKHFPTKEESCEKDGHYFLKILEEQSIRLLALADSVDTDIDNPNLSEEIIGKLRSASGKAKLLVSQKMQQFKGLCTNNINQCAGEAFPTTNQDLQGFWDMVMLQVDQVDRIFEEINILRDNNWIEETTKKNEVKRNGVSKVRKTISKPKVTAAAEEARKQREEQRKKIIEDRRKAMKAQQSSQPSIKIFVPESS